MGSLLDKMVSSIAQVFWTVNVLSQAIAAGFAFSYVVVFGSFLQWTIRRRNWEFFTEQYAPFRRKLKVRRTYFAFLPVGPLLVAVLSLIANHGRHALLPQVLAVVFFPRQPALCRLKPAFCYTDCSTPVAGLPRTPSPTGRSRGAAARQCRFTAPAESSSGL